MAMEQRDLELLKKIEDDILETLNVIYLIPYLRAGKNKLLTEDEVKYLTATANSSANPAFRKTAAKEFLTILKTKGRGALSIFVNSLRLEEQHRGHKSLYEMFKQEEEIENPKDAVSQHQLLQPVEQTELSNTEQKIIMDRSSLVLPTSSSTSSFNDHQLEGGRKSTLTSPSQKSGSLGSSSRVSGTSSPINLIMQHLIEIDANVKGMKDVIKSTSSSSMHGSSSSSVHGSSSSSMHGLVPGNIETSFKQNNEVCTAAIPRRKSYGKMVSYAIAT